MKIYTKVVIDMHSGEELESESYDYFGSIALCGSGGGGSETNTVDYEYNSRMAGSPNSLRSILTLHKHRTLHFFLEVADILWKLIKMFTGAWVGHPRFPAFLKWGQSGDKIGRYYEKKAYATSLKVS